MKIIDRNDPCIHGDPGMCDECFNGSKLKRRIDAMKTHTPTPWKADGRAIVGPRMEQEIAVCSNDEKEDEVYITDEEAYANAAFIVKATSHHDEMVEFIQWFVYGSKDIDENHKRLDQAKKIISEMNK